MAREEEDDLMNDLMTVEFVKQLLTLHGFANKYSGFKLGDSTGRVSYQHSYSIKLHIICYSFL